jgi:hypothetical protein
MPKSPQKQRKPAKAKTLKDRIGKPKTEASKNRQKP